MNLLYVSLLIFIVSTFCSSFSHGSTKSTLRNPGLNRAPMSPSPEPSSRCDKHKSGAETEDLLVLGGTIVTMAADAPGIIQNGTILICSGIIKFVGTKEEFKSIRSSRSDFCTAPIRKVNKLDVIVPSFINTHTHAAMSLFKNLGNDLPLGDWLNNFIFPIEGNIVDEGFCRTGAKLAMAEYLASGTSTFADMYFFQDAVAEEVVKVGMRAFLGEGVIDFPQPDSPTPDNTFSFVEAYLKKWSKHPLVQVYIAPHAPYTTSASVYKKAVRLNRKYGVRTWSHCSETKTENADMRVHQGLPTDSNTSSTEFLASIGVLGADVTCAHSVWLSDEDIKIYKSTGTKAAHCPSSNLKLASGVLRYPAIVAAGVPMGMGTDGQSSNNDVDIVTETHIASLLHKGANLNAEVAPAFDMLKHLTIEGAAAVQREDKQGSLEVGKVGDLTVFRGNSIKWTPRYDIGTNGTGNAADTAALIVYNSNANDVKGTIISGRLLYWNGCYTTLDISEVRADAEKYSQKIRDYLAGQSNN